MNSEEALHMLVWSLRSDLYNPLEDVKLTRIDEVHHLLRLHYGQKSVEVPSGTQAELRFIDEYLSSRGRRREFSGYYGFQMYW